MKYLTAIIIAIFIGITFFGFVPMSHGMSHDMVKMNADCPIAALVSRACVPDAISMALSHVSALQLFSSSPTSSIYVLASTLALLGLALLFFISLTSSFDVPVANVLLAGRWRPLSYAFTISKRRETSWLSLFEHSPSR